MTRSAAEANRFGRERHHHQADRHLDRDHAVALLSPSDLTGQGERFLHRARLLFQARPAGDAVPGHVPGRRLLLQDGERVPDRPVQPRPVSGMRPLRVVQQDQVQPLVPELLAVAANLPRTYCGARLCPATAWSSARTPSFTASAPVAAVKNPVFVAMRTCGTAAEEGQGAAGVPAGPTGPRTPG
ncbi:hypothetical protein [Streptomyces sp. NPDC097610]|uniref:hypothetical protein n=1 Tax=Streptomyces sp. NPDC097610 TaxID=3157227 RepID=UPI00333435A4